MVDPKVRWNGIAGVTALAVVAVLISIFRAVHGKIEESTFNRRSKRCPNRVASS